MAENRYYALFGVPAPEEGSNTPEVTEPAAQAEEQPEPAQGEDTGSNAPEVTEPAAEDNGNSPGETQPETAPQEPEGEGGRHQQRDGNPRSAGPAAPSPRRHVVGGGRNPYSLRTCWPSADRTRSVNLCAWSWALLALTVAIG